MNTTKEAASMSPHRPPITVQAVVAKLLEDSGKTQREIAIEMGFPKPNVLSMIKLGQTKLPLDKAAALAIACGADPVFLIRLALSEYHPNVWHTLVSALGEPLTKNERSLLEIHRAIDPAGDLEIDDKMERELVAALQDTVEPDPADPIAAALRYLRSRGR
jgi:transcriptional regulator with XRE-family HTH domain